uniref:Uncharacterized protein n=1 Tax=Sphaerodactylus townsendi TaxID=933632 RepID=A0ACB8GCY7_9SAUR
MWTGTFRMQCQLVCLSPCSPRFLKLCNVHNIQNKSGCDFHDILPLKTCIKQSHTVLEPRAGQKHEMQIWIDKQGPGNFSDFLQYCLQTDISFTNFLLRNVYLNAPP